MTNEPAEPLPGGSEPSDDILASDATAGSPDAEEADAPHETPASASAESLSPESAGPESAGGQGRTVEGETVELTSNSRDSSQTTDNPSGGTGAWPADQSASGPTDV